MNNLTIKNYKGINVTDSREVAEMTGKRHDNLLRDINGYIEVISHSSKLRSENFFIESEYVNSRNQKQPCYLLTKQGCEMVANKMTGEKGILFTAEYVQAFNKMEQHIKIGNQDLLIQFISSLPQEQIKLIITQLSTKLLPAKPVKQALYDFLADNRECLSLTYEDFVEVDFKVFSNYFESNGYKISDVLKELKNENLIKPDGFGFCVKGSSKIVIKMKPSLKFYQPNG